MKQMWSKEEILKLIENNSYYVHELRVDGEDEDERNIIGIIQFISTSKEPTLDVKKMKTLLTSSVLEEDSTLSAIVTEVYSISPTALSCKVIGNDTQGVGITKQIDLTLEDITLYVYDANGNAVLQNYHFS